MALSRRVRNEKRPGALHVVQRPGSRTTGEFPAVTPQPKPAEDVNPISKSKHWKLLYASNPEAEGEGSDSPTKDVPESAREEEGSAGYKGLCKNCQKRDDCKLPKLEGGVWRCEEYE